MGKAFVRVSLLALALWPAAACDQEGPAGPTAALAGTWRGTILDSAAGSGTMTLTIGQRGAGVLGTWSSTFADGSFNRSGSFSGTVVGSPFVLFLRPSVPIVCGGDVTLTGTLALSTTVAGDRMTGTYTVLNCSGVITGTIDIARE
jgi:hypothetical protein